MPSYSGVWSLSQQFQARGQGLWPTPPGAPTIGTVTAGLALCASVPFTAPACAGVPPTLTYTATSAPGCITVSGAGSPLTFTGLTACTAYTFRVKATNASGTGPCSAASNSVTAKVATCATYSTAGTYSWVAPAGVTSVAILAVGGGGGGTATVNGARGGGGGGLGYRNAVSVTPGTSYAVVVGAGGTSNNNGGNSSFTTVVTATGGKNSVPNGTPSGGTFSGTSVSGGTGGTGGQAFSCHGGGGGGAAGYTGNGGAGGQGCGSGQNGTAGSGGGAGGGGGGSEYVSGSTTWRTAGAGGGGVGLLGAGANGAGGCKTGTGYANPFGGGGGSSGAAGTNQPGTPYGVEGGAYGGGGSGGGYYNCSCSTIVRGCGGPGNRGAVRIVWAGGARGTPSFPSTNVGPS